MPINFRRFSIASMMGFVLFASLTVAALKKPTALSASCFYAASVGVLLFCTVGMILRRGRWTGFAVFGWGFLLMTQMAHDAGRPGFPTVFILRPLFVYLQLPILRSEVEDDYTNWDFFEQTGNSVFVLLAGFFGAVVTGYFTNDHQGKSRSATNA